MKRIQGARRQFLAHGLAAIVLGCVALVPVASAEGEAVVLSAGGAPYVSGGVGDESIERLNAQAGQFNLKLVFALSAGDYVSDVGVSIADAKGRIVLAGTSDGPWFYTRLPAGSYRVSATLAERTVKRQVSIGRSGLKTVDFRWPSP